MADEKEKNPKTKGLRKMRLFRKINMNEYSPDWTAVNRALFTDKEIQANGQQHQLPTSQPPRS